ncbi:hypothetical protein [Methylobacterium planeticum]|nr:hypothetical protein [Methylobacterium planeticum]
MSSSVVPSIPAAQSGRGSLGSLFDRMIQAWLGHYQRIIDAGSHPL